MEVAGNSAHEYSPEAVARVKATCLTLAQVLGEELMRETVIVGGLVPTLLYPDAIPSAETGPHVGTLDVDLVLDLVILEDNRYEDMAKRLLRASFAPDTNLKGNLTRQRWRSQNGISIDFLMPPVPPDERAAKLQGLTGDLAVQTMRGLDLALTHALTITLGGTDLEARNVSRAIPVCAPHIFIALKALAMGNRDKHKDAYDIYYVLKHDYLGPEALGNMLAAFADRPPVADGISFLDRDFQTVDGRGPIDVCRFLGELGNEDLAADVLAFSLAFMSGYRAASSDPA